MVFDAYLREFCELFPAIRDVYMVKQKVNLCLCHDPLDSAVYTAIHFDPCIRIKYTCNILQIPVSGKSCFHLMCVASSSLRILAHVYPYHL